LRPLWKFLICAQWKTTREARRWRPDVVLAGSGLTAPAALMAARLSGARAAVYAHGLDLTVSHPVYKSIWRPSLRYMDRIIANSRPTAGLAHQIGVKPERVGIAHPGVDLPTNLPDESEIAKFRAQHELGGRPLLLSVGRLSARKGLREFVSRSLPQIVAASPEALLLIVGDVPK